MGAKLFRVRALFAFNDRDGFGLGVETLNRAQYGGCVATITIVCSIPRSGSGEATVYSPTARLRR